MKLILTPKHFELGGHSCTHCPVYHALRDLGAKDIDVLWNSSSFILNYQRYYVQHPQQLFEIIEGWDTQNTIPKFPCKIEITLDTNYHWE